MGNTTSPRVAHNHPILGVSEFLENVLLDLSPDDTLYKAQGVCKFCV
ncbi:hypothetical protein G6011_11572, partial [Alternaria panax]